MTSLPTADDRRSERRFRALPAALVASLTVAAAAAPPATRPAPTDWAEFAPADARVFVEIRDLSIVRHHLKRVGMWNFIRTVADDVTPPPQAGVPWQQRTEELLGMSTEEAVVRVLGLRTALFAVDPWRWDAGLVLSEVGDEAALRRLMLRWSAQPDGRLDTVEKFKLRGGLVAAVRGRLLLLGPDGDAEGFWTRSLLLLAGRGGPTLAGDAEFRRLRGPVLERPSGGVAYLRAPASAADPTEALLAAFQVGSDGVAVELRRPADKMKDDPPPASIVPRLPPDIVAAWEGTLDLPGLIRSRQNQPDQVRLSLAAFFSGAMLTDVEDQNAVLNSLGSRVAVTLSIDPAPDEFARPAVTLLVPTTQPAVCVDAFDRVAETGRLWVNALWPQSAQPAEPLGAVERVGGRASMRRISVGPYLRSRTRCPFFGQLELAWGGVDGWFLVSTSSGALDRTVRTMVADDARLADDPLWAAAIGDGPCRDLLVVRGPALGEMLQSWIDYVERTRPEALTSEFWRGWANRRITEKHRLGVALEDGPDGTRVVEVTPGTPAAVYLRPGDVIVAAAGLDARTAVTGRRVADAFARVNGPSFAVTVRREGANQVIAIPLEAPLVGNPAAFNPAAAVRRLRMAAEHVDLLTLHRRPSAVGDVMQISIRWRPPAPTRDRR